MKIIYDSREQAAFTFNSYPEVETVQGSLTTGDYSVPGLESVCAVERKSLPDLVGCLGRERERFKRELERAASLQAFAVVIEASFLELAHGEYRSKLKPHAALQSVLAFSARLRIPFIFAGNRGGAEYACYHFLRQFVKGEQQRLKAIEQAIGAA